MAAAITRGIVASLAALGVAGARAEPAAAPGSGPTAPLSDRVASYEIEARLDTDAHSLAGRETLRWTNRSAQPQRQLWFHLYWNAFQNERSAFLREARTRGRARVDLGARDDWGWSRVTSVRVGGAEIAGTLRWEPPVAAAEPALDDDRTVFGVTLPAPVAPGSSVAVEISWESHVPRLVAKTGRHADFYMAGQWFPKVAVLELPGTRGATAPRWNVHAYHATTEFYADFGSYDVSLTVPADMIVGATGVMVDRRPGPGGTVVWRFRQDDVHDFAWAAWSGFRVVEEVFRAPGLPEVSMTLLLHPEHEAARPQILEAARAALESYGRAWAPYPYPHLTIVDVPETVPEAAAQEYPTLVTIATHRAPVEPRDFQIWMGVAHELAHQWWYGIVASNEFEEAWLDEGLASWGAARLLAEHDVRLDLSRALPVALRRPLGALLPPALDPGAFSRMALAAPVETPIATPGWRFKDSGDYMASCYSRAELTVSALERVLGSDLMRRGVRAYLERFQFRHPGTSDLETVLSEVSGRPLAPLFDDLVRGSHRIDRAVEPIRCAPEDPGRAGGLYGDAPGDLRFVDPRTTPPAATPAWRCAVTLVRRDAAALPLRFRTTFEDGAVEESHWAAEDAEPRWRRVEWVRPSPVRQVEIDPGEAPTLDASRADDSATREADARVPAGSRAGSPMPFRCCSRS